MPVKYVLGFRSAFDDLELDSLSDHKGFMVVYFDQAVFPDASAQKILDAYKENEEEAKTKFETRCRSLRDLYPALVKAMNNNPKGCCAGFIAQWFMDIVDTSKIGKQGDVKLMFKRMTEKSKQYDKDHADKIVAVFNKSIDRGMGGLFSTQNKVLFDELVGQSFKHIYTIQKTGIGMGKKVGNLIKKYIVIRNGLITVNKLIVKDKNPAQIRKEIADMDGDYASLVNALNTAEEERRKKLAEKFKAIFADRSYSLIGYFGEGGHAVGCVCDPELRAFAYFDPNYGVARFFNKESLQSWLISYLAKGITYNYKYTDMDAYILSPK